MKLLALDAMGVIFQAADDVTEMLLPFVSRHSVKKNEMSNEFVEELYLRCSLGEFSSAEFWSRVGVPPELESKYLGGHALVENVKEFISEARDGLDSIWCVSNDVSEWSIKLRQRFGLEELLDGFIISGDVKSRKPYPEIFLALFEAAGTVPSEVVFVDDRPKNVIAARDLGITSILFGPQQGATEGSRHALCYTGLRKILF